MLCLSEVGAIFLKSHSFGTVMSQQAEEKQKDAGNIAARWQFVKAYDPCSFGSTFKEILKCAYREAEWVPPQYSQRKVSGAQLSS